MDLNTKLYAKAKALDVNDDTYQPKGLSKLLLEALERIQQLETEIEKLNEQLNSNSRQ
jgi:hypothetical protein